MNHLARRMQAAVIPAKGKFMKCKDKDPIPARKLDHSLVSNSKPYNKIKQSPTDVGPI